MKKIIIFGFVILMLVACSSAGSTNITGEWKLVSHGDSANPTPAISDVDTSIVFNVDGSVNGNVGCNGFGGSYEVSGDTISFSSMISTMMFCDETSAQEQAVLKVFSGNAILEIQMGGDGLTITSADGASVVNLARK